MRSRVASILAVNCIHQVREVVFQQATDGEGGEAGNEGVVAPLGIAALNDSADDAGERFFLRKIFFFRWSPISYSNFT
ncbi:hypothetical protein AY600_00125 [Phormidium willei BDU 130791]|nr:hypothetical protein AY600_00125 [Phormidium willei BDU 130791]